MAGYRDELDALTARSEALERELADKRREVDDLRQGGPPAERFEKLERDLAAAQAELARLRGPRRPPSRLPALLVAGGATLISAGVAAVIFLRAAGPTPVTPAPAVAETPPALAPVSLPSTPPVPAVPPVPEVTPPAPPLPRAKTHLDTSWKARAVRVHGASVSVGAACVIEAALSSDDEPHVDRLRVACGSHTLYSSDDSFSGMSSTSWDVHEEPAPGGKFRRALAYEDSGDRHGRSDVALDTSKGVARVWSGGVTPMEIELGVDRLDAPSDVSVNPK